MNISRCSILGVQPMFHALHVIFWLEVAIFVHVKTIKVYFIDLIIRSLFQQHMLRLPLVNLLAHTNTLAAQTPTVTTSRTALQLSRRPSTLWLSALDLQPQPSSSSLLLLALTLSVFLMFTVAPTDTSPRSLRPTVSMSHSPLASSWMLRL